MDEPQSFLFDDPESTTRRTALNVVHARAATVASFDSRYFAGYRSMRALTYTASIPTIADLLAKQPFEDFECIFGHGGILRREATEILAFQRVVREKLAGAVVGVKGLGDEGRENIYRRVADDEVRFFVVKDAIAHAKIYLLEGDGKTRVIVGSANLSERAFSGRQAETLVVFDDDETAWNHYLAQYEAVRDAATSRLDLPRASDATEDVRVEETPALLEAQSNPDGATLYVPGERPEEAGYSVPEITARIETIKPAYSRGLADLKPNRRGDLLLKPRTVRQIVQIVRSRDAEAGPRTYLSRRGTDFVLSGEKMPLDADPEQVRGDVARWLEFFGNYENGFVGDVPRLQRDYFAFMCWFYMAPLMCDLRNAALRENAFSFDQPLFAVLYGSSNCGKTSLVEALMASMFSYPRIVDTLDFTPAKLRALQQAYKRFPVVFDDVTRDRFNRYADEIIKDETIPYAEYPCFALSMNADARSFKPEIVKRCLMIYTRTALPGDNTTARRTLQRSVANIRDRLTTALYREYLKRALAALDSPQDGAADLPATAERGDQEPTDALHLSSSTLCALFEENLPPGASMPPWCARMTLESYQERAFERPRLFLGHLLGADRYHSARRPPEGCWSLSGNNIVVSVSAFEFTRTRADIPDWLLDDTASASGQITLDRKLTEDFLGRRIRAPRRWPWRRP